MIPFADGSVARTEDYAVGTVVEMEVPWSDEMETSEIDNDIAAVIFNHNGQVEDLTYNIETARSMVNEGFLALVVQPSEMFSIEELQRSLDLEAVAYADCFDKSWKNHQVL